MRATILLFTFTSNTEYLHCWPETGELGMSGSLQESDGGQISLRVTSAPGIKRVLCEQKRQQFIYGGRAAGVRYQGRLP